MATTTIFTTMTALAESTGAINLGQGFPDEDGPAVVVDAAVEALRAGHNQYAPLPGIPALREAVAAHQLRYGIELDPDTQVQVTFGATEALASALLALVSPGDEVAMLDPSYDSYGAVVTLRRRRAAADPARAAGLARGRRGRGARGGGAHARAAGQLAAQPHRARAGRRGARPARRRLPPRTT